MLLHENYSSAAKPGAKHISVLKRFFERISSPELADVAPWFRKNGSAAYFGTDLIRAAASRPDIWQADILGFLNGFTREEYRGLMDDLDPAVRDVASFFLGPFWRREEIRQREEAASVQALRDELELARSRIPPNGAGSKLKWLAVLAMKRLKRAS